MNRPTSTAARLAASQPLRILKCAGLALILASPAAAQLGGTWNITAHSCCAYPEGTECEDSTLTFAVVTQTGNQLSGSTLDPSDLPSECHDVTCTPTTPNCDQPVELSGTVSGGAVDLTLERVQSLHATCTAGMLNCGVSFQVNATAPAHGTVTGNTIAGSFEMQDNVSCQVSGPPACQDAIACSNVACTGTFAVTIGSCMGDCVGDGLVTVDELVMMVNIALGNMEVSACDVGDGNEDGQITVDEIVTAVNHALNGCA